MIVPLRIANTIICMLIVHYTFPLYKDYNISMKYSYGLPSLEVLTPLAHVGYIVIG